ncbi:hypothetical protein [Methylobacterium aquaticum]|uniref:hypothetical protein n=1 Tax=Methylobacterium aquaticum TaxID=270351 RepID=UPI001933FE2A|nr:hypothetical protein [Methylobacterium aquaticum]QRE74094.1 hypothetical protein F1D61_11115 [Methylobacterium aquaticum]
MLAAAKQRYAANREAARLAAATAASQTFGIEIQLSGWTSKASSAWASQWIDADRRSASSWDWDAIHHAYSRELDRFDLAMWSGERLCGLALATMSRSIITINFLEGDPRTDCPLQGKRAAIAVEAAQNYGQLSGRRFLRVQPIHPRLETLYCDIFGFTLATNKGGRAYYQREIP